MAKEPKEKDKLRYIPAPVMAHKDDRRWIKEKISYIHERYRWEIAYLYSKLFFKALHETGVPDIKRVNHAREKVNKWLNTITNEIIKDKSEFL